MATQGKRTPLQVVSKCWCEVNTITWAMQRPRPLWLSCAQGSERDIQEAVKTGHTEVHDALLQLQVFLIRSPWILRPG